MDEEEPSVPDPARRAPCPGCGLILPDHPGGFHPRMGASSACWARFGKALAREFTDPAYYRDVHFLTVATYTVQHPPPPSGAAAETLALQLIALQLATDGRVPLAQMRRIIARLAASPPRRVRWLEPPRPNGTVTIEMVLRAASAEQHRTAVRGWATNVWRAWLEHHQTIRGWATEALR
jgi:Family of unknown function (DUF5946)